MARKLFYSSISTETSSFSAIETSYQSFVETGIKVGDAIFQDEEGKLSAFGEKCAEFETNFNFEICAGISADAEPGTPMPLVDYYKLKQQLLDELEQHMPVDAVYLGLHGAMMAESCDDCEGDLLAAIKQIVGNDVPIGCVLDPHAHLTEKMVTNSNILSFMKEYPHTDGFERGQEVLETLVEILDEGLLLSVSVVDCELLGFFPTQEQPMRGFVDTIYELEQQDFVQSISFVHGFPWGDTADTGAKVLVYGRVENGRTCPETNKLTDEIALQLNQHIHRIKSETGLTALSIAGAVEVVQKGARTPIILADVADNPGGGAPSDSTFIVQALMNESISNVAVGLIYAPDVISKVKKLNVSDKTQVSLGGMLSNFSGVPLKLNAEIKAIRLNAQMDVAGLVQFPMGDAVWLRAEGVDFVVTNQRIQPYSPDAFESLGIELASYNAIIVKSTNHFRAFFTDISEHIYNVNTPGAIDFDFNRLPVKKVSKHYFPFNPDAEGCLLEGDWYIRKNKNSDGETNA